MQATLITSRAPSSQRLCGCAVGLTLIEILMTIFVLAIGLLGVAALMPVGSYQMQRGQIAQRVSEIGPCCARSD